MIFKEAVGYELITLMINDDDDDNDDNKENYTFKCIKPIQN